MGNPSPPKRRRRRSPPLPDDLVYETLTRLPAKSVARFHCVCKRWLSLATRPEFALANASRARTSAFFIASYSGRAELLPLDRRSRLSDPLLSSLDHDGLPPGFCGSCNGLVLLRKSPWNSPASREKPPALCVVNPLTGAHHFIPTPPETMWLYIRSGRQFLAFDPLVSPHFKVVSAVLHPIVPEWGEEICSYIHIYSSETREWRLHSRELGQKYKYSSFLHAVFWNGCLVWENSNTGLICLDMRTEQIDWLPLPSVAEEDDRCEYSGGSGEQHVHCSDSDTEFPHYDIWKPEDNWCRYFGESGGHLHCVPELDSYTEFGITHFEILEFRPDTSGWFVLHKVDLDCIKNAYPKVNHVVVSSQLKILSFLRDDRRSGDRLLLSIPEKIVCFHLHDKRFSTVCSGLPDIGFAGDDWTSIFPHAFSLISPNTNPEADALCKDWVYWKREHDKVLMDLMVDYSVKGQRSGSDSTGTLHGYDFSTGVWHEMVEKFNASTGLRFDVNHLKSRLMSYRRDYNAVNKMLMLKGGKFHWDPTIEMVIAGDAAWRNHLRGSYEARYYRRARVPFKTLEVICGSHPASFHGAQHSAKGSCSRKC